MPTVSIYSSISLGTALLPSVLVISLGSILRKTFANHYWREGFLSNALAVFITFHFVCFGLLIFSGRIGTPPLQHYFAEIEQADCHEISGWVWDKYKPRAPVSVELWDGKEYLMTISAN